jgi:hypothetical protein
LYVEEREDTRKFH